MSGSGDFVRKKKHADQGQNQRQAHEDVINEVSPFHKISSFRFDLQRSWDKCSTVLEGIQSMQLKVKRFVIEILQLYAVFLYELHDKGD